MNQYNENNKRHGPWEDFYFNGQLFYRGSYNDGLRHGLWERYFKNGKLRYRGKFINDIEIGFSIWRDKTYFHL